MWRRRSSAPGRRSARATRTAVTTSSVRCCRPPRASSPRARCHSALQPHPQVSIERFASSDLGTEQQVHDFHSAMPPEFRLDARAAEPLAPLTGFLDGYSGRVLIAADSPGRREVIVEMLSAHGRRPRALSGWEAFAEGDARLAICVAEDIAGLCTHRAAPAAARRIAAVRHARPPGAAAPHAVPPIRRRSCAICRASSPARRWCTRPTASAATSVCR